MSTRKHDAAAAPPVSTPPLKKRSSVMLQRRNSSEPSTISNVTAELVLFNRTSSFSKITYELTETTTEHPPSTPSTPPDPILKRPSTTTKQAPASSSHFAARLSVLLSRSSGRDKFAAFLQYFAMFVGHQNLVAVSQDADAPWRNVEESMSSGRKVLRLLKWIKELERVQRSITHEDMGPHHSRLRALVARVLGFFMHAFSTLYYLVDNVIWASQVGLVNRPNVTGEPGHFRALLSRDLPFPEYIQLQHRHRAEEALRHAAKARENRMKDMKNYASFCRLVFAIVYCSLQLDSIRQEVVRLSLKQASLLEEARSPSKPLLNGGGGATTTTTTTKHLPQDDDDDNDDDGNGSEEDSMALSISREAQVVNRMQPIFKHLDETALEHRRELWASVANLLILLKRLEIGVFNRLPMWGVGILGVISSILGLQKNWPVVA
jgi:hypothetical protein